MLPEGYVWNLPVFLAGSLIEMSQLENLNFYVDTNKINESHFSNIMYKYYEKYIM